MSIKNRYLQLLLVKFADQDNDEQATAPLPISDPSSNTELKSSPKSSFFENLLLKHDIKPLAISSNDTSFLGNGLSSFVFRITFNGKEAAAKITDNSSDVAIYKEIMQRKSSLGRAGSILPTVYDIIKDPETNYHIIITEILQPLNPHLKNLLFDYGKSLKKPKKLSSSLSQEAVEKIIKSCVDNFHLPVENPQLKKELVRRLNILFRMIFRQKDFHQFIVFNEEVKFTPELLKLISYQVIDVFKKYNYSKINYLGLLDDLENYFKIAFAKSFPISSKFKDELNVSKALPQSKELSKALIELQNAGISFADLHEHNLMQRKDGSIVIADPGNFSSSSSPSNNSDINTLI